MSKKQFNLQITKDLVWVYLNTFPDTRNDGNKLLKRIWSDEAVREGLDKEQVDLFLDLMMNRKLSQASTILRSRNIVLEHFPQWRNEETYKYTNQFKKELRELE
jgi:hypothetical protein